MSDSNFVRQADRIGDRLGAWGKEHERTVAFTVLGAVVGWVVGAVAPVYVGFLLGGVGFALVVFVIWAMHHKGDGNEGQTTSGPKA